MTGSTWITQEKLELMLVEKIMEREYTMFINTMERLVEMPYSYRVKDFIQKFRKPLMKQLSSQTTVPEIKYDENGRSYITTYGEF